MTSKKYIVSLIKFTNYDKSFLSGSIYMNRLHYFTNLERKEVGDSKEGTIAVINFGANKLFMQDTSLDLAPVCCFFCVTRFERDFSKPIIIDDERIKGFGNKAVVINNVAEFISRIKKVNSEYNFELIRYIDIKNPTGSNKFGIYNPITVKDLYFSYQNEFRIYRYAKFDEQIQGNDYFGDSIRKQYVSSPEILNIGDIHDITETYETEDLFGGINPKIKIYQSELEESLYLKKLTTHK